jgi:hypothetical protein
MQGPIKKSSVRVSIRTRSRTSSVFIADRVVSASARVSTVAALGCSADSADAHVVEKAVAITISVQVKTRFRVCASARVEYCVSIRVAACDAVVVAAACAVAIGGCDLGRRRS